MGEGMEYYKVFYTDRPLPGGAEPDFTFVMPLNFATREEALKEAFKRMFGGAVVWKIEGPEGFRMDRAEVERQYALFKTS